MGRSLATLAVAAALICGGPADSVFASAPGPALATVTAETPIAAGGGWLLWSAPVGAHWGLEAFHAGRVSALPVATRPQPFDVSVGTDGHGAPVATFSRCRATPKMRDVGLAESTGGALLEPQGGSGCRLYVLDLASGRERVLPVPQPPRASDTSPSMWHGSVAFARKAPGHGDVWQVMLWSPRAPRVLRTLRHGAIPSHCPAEPGGCTVRPAHGEVEALDYVGGLVTFVWSVSGPGVLGEGGWEVRTDEVGSDRSRLAEASFGHEACTAPLRPGELEYVWPEAPVTDGHVVLAPLLEGYDCFSAFGSALRSYAPGANPLRSGQFATTVLAVAKDGQTVYGLGAPPAPFGADSPACSAAAPCSLEPITLPPLSVERSAPSPPFE